MPLSVVVMSVGPCTEMFNKVSNDHGRTQKCDSSVLANLFQKIKITENWYLD